MNDTSRAARCNVLVVERHWPTRNAYTDLLAADGYGAIAVASYADALELCQAVRVPIDIVLTELRHRDASGRDLASRLREHQPHLAGAIYVTGCVIHDALQDSLNPWECVLTKPVDFSRVESVIDSFLRLRGRASPPRGIEQAGRPGEGEQDADLVLARATT